MKKLFWSIALIVILLVPLTGCGGGGGGGGGGKNGGNGGNGGNNGKGVTVTINPQLAYVAPGGSLTFTATVTGTANTGVNWVVEEGEDGGDISENGLYKAPDDAGTFHVKAISRADSAKTATATVLVTNGFDYSTVQRITGTITVNLNNTINYNYDGHFMENTYIENVYFVDLSLEGPISASDSLSWKASTCIVKAGTTLTREEIIHGDSSPILTIFSEAGTGDNKTVNCDIQVTIYPITGVYQIDFGGVPLNGIVTTTPPGTSVDAKLSTFAGWVKNIPLPLTSDGKLEGNKNAEPLEPKQGIAPSSCIITPNVTWNLTLNKPHDPTD